MARIVERQNAVMRVCLTKLAVFCKMQPFKTLFDTKIAARPSPSFLRTVASERTPRKLAFIKCSAEENTKNFLFIFGLGYSGIAAANYFRNRGWRVVGTARTKEKRDALQARGFEVYNFAPDEYELLGGRALQCLENATHVLSTVPPTEEQTVEDPVLMAHMRVFGDNARRYKWIGYISSTSVYGDHEGDWVTEQSEVRAQSGKGFVRLMAEQEWLHMHYNYYAPVHVFRCGGIYGPRRSAIEAVQQRGLPSPNQQRRAQKQFTSRVHIYDICRTLEASISHPNPGAIYNVVDDVPASRLEVMGYAAHLLAEAGWKTAVPSFDGHASSGESEDGEHTVQPKRGATPTPAGKRVSNQRIKREVKLKLAFPSYREGLAAIMQHDFRPFDYK